MKHRRTKPNPRSRVPAIDIHAHFVPEGYLRMIETEGEAYGVHLRSGPDGPMILVGQAAIGPITARTLRTLGLRVHIQPDRYTIPALARAIAVYYSS